MTDSTLNFYDVLSLKKTATFDEIKKAYHILVLKWHPDRNKDNHEEAKKKFKEIHEAYKILSNPELREKYDNMDENNHDKNKLINHEGNMIDPSTILDEAMKDEDSEIPPVMTSINAKMHELHVGFTDEISFERFSKCGKCSGHGTKNGKDGKCRNCEGIGIIMKTVEGGKVGYMINENVCNLCEGNGIDPGVKKCSKCKGIKYVKETISTTIQVPAGAYDGYGVIIKEKGNYIPNEDRNGINSKKKRTDVICIIKEDKHDLFERGIFDHKNKNIDYSSILINITIDFFDSLVGYKGKLKNFDDSIINVSIDDIIQNGDIYMLENLGINKINKNERGNILLKFDVNKPQLDKKKRIKLYEKITGKKYVEKSKKYIIAKKYINDNNYDEDDDYEEDDESYDSNSDSE